MNLQIACEVHGLVFQLGTVLFSIYGSSLQRGSGGPEHQPDGAPNWLGDFSVARQTFFIYFTPSLNTD